MDKNQRKNQIEERVYAVWKNPKFKDRYQKEMIGTQTSLLINAESMDCDSSSARIFFYGKDKKGCPHQIFYISPGIVATAVYDKKGEKLKQISCIGHPEDHEASKLILEKLVDACPPREPENARIKLIRQSAQSD